MNNLNRDGSSALYTLGTYITQEQLQTQQPSPRNYDSLYTTKCSCSKLSH